MRKIYTIALFVFLFFVSFAAAEKVAELPQPGKPDSIACNGKRFYIVEESAFVHIYKISGKKHALKVEYIKKFGREGEGPGEFKGYPRLKLFPAELLIRSAGKIAWFTRDGILKEEKRISIPLLKNHIEPLSTNYVARNLKVFGGEKGQSTYVTIDLFDSNFKKIRNFARADHSNPTKEFVVPPHLLTFKIHNNKVFIANTKKGFFFNILDKEGQMLYKIEKKYEKIKISERFKKDTIAEIGKDMGPAWEFLKKKLKFPEYFPAMQDFIISGENIYARTFHKNYDSDMVEFIVMDLKGNNSRSVFLPDADDLFTINSHKYFYLLENEEKEMWELHMVEVK